MTLPPNPTPMSFFHGVPVFRLHPSVVDDTHVLTIQVFKGDSSTIYNGVSRGLLVLIRALPFERATTLFGDLVDRYGLRDSYDAQMQYVVSLMAAREPVDQVAVTVNKRGPYQMIQPHCEGDSSSPLELFGLYCVQNAESGGENILSLISQDADHSGLRAKEKAIINNGMSSAEMNRLRRNHLDAKTLIPEVTAGCRVLAQVEHGSIVVRGVPLVRSRSVISGEDLVTYWDNVTVHDRAFHRFHYEMLKHVGIFHCNGDRSGYEAYMHVEDDSPWAPADTCSGDVERTSKLFLCHIIYKMEPGDLLVFNNRAWTHSSNNWPPDQVRTLRAMYA